MRIQANKETSKMSIYTGHVRGTCLNFGLFFSSFPSDASRQIKLIRDLKIYDAAARRRGFITKDILIEDNSHE